MIDENQKEPQILHGFEEIEHTADAALKVRGKDLAQLMTNAAKGMTSIIQDPDASFGSLHRRRVEIYAEDMEGLLVEWLGELAYLAETESLLFESCEFAEVGPTAIQSSVSLWKACRTKAYVKAVTYHDLKVEETQNGLEATVVFDL